MKALAITSKGIEDISSLEIKELINSKAKIKDSCVIFNIKKLEDLCLLCYKAQSVEKILFLFDFFDFKDNNDLNKKIKDVIKKIKFDNWLEKSNTFRVTCKLLKSKISKGLEMSEKQSFSEHTPKSSISDDSKNFQNKINNEDLSSEEIAGNIGALIIERIKESKKYQQNVDLNNPDITFLIFINKNTAYFGIDFSGRDLHKREYKLFAHPNSLRSTIAYSLLMIAELKPKEILLDPFCHSGEIPIEAALFATNFPLNYYSKEKFTFLKFKPFKKFNFKKFYENIDNKIIKTKKPSINCFDSNLMNLTAAKKNAKIAGINKSINFSRMDIEWLDTKLDKECIDKIITHPIEPTRTTNIKDIEKLYDQFFYQAEFILKKTGKIVLISINTDLLKKSAEKYKFKLEKEIEVCSGQQVLRVIAFSKLKST